MKLLFLCLLTVALAADPPFNTPALDTGLSGVVTIPAASQYEFLSGSFTVEVWVKIRSLSESGIVTSVLTASSGGCGWGILGQDSNTIAWYLGGGGCTPQVINAKGFSTDCWHHLAGVRDGSTLRFYVDTVEVGTLSASALSISGNKDVVIGRRYLDASGYHFRGWVQDLRIWNTARTQAQLGASMGLQQSPTTGLVGYWKFDEGSGVTLADSSSNTNAGSATGVSWAAIGHTKHCSIHRIASYSLSSGLKVWPEAHQRTKTITATADNTIVMSMFQVSSASASTYIVNRLLVNGVYSLSSQTLFGNIEHGTNVGMHFGAIAKGSDSSATLYYRSGSTFSYTWDTDETVALHVVPLEGATMLLDQAGTYSSLSGDYIHSYPGLDQVPFTVTEDNALCMFWYHASGETSGGYHVGNFDIDNVDQTDMRDIQGRKSYAGVQGLKVKAMSAGAHTVSAQYRQQGGTTAYMGPSSDYRTSHVYVVQLPSTAELLVNKNPTNSFTQPTSWTTWNGLSDSFTLSRPTRVVIWYHINGHTGSDAYQARSRLILDDIERPTGRSRMLGVYYYNNQGMWTGVLTAGSHDVRVEGFTTSGVSWSLSDWRARSLFVLGLPTQEGECLNGTQNTPTEALPSPALGGVAITANAYQVSFNYDRRYSAIKASFDGTTACDYDSTVDGTQGGNARWTVQTGADDCTATITYSHSAQDTLATCGFTKSVTPVNGYHQYTTTISLTTYQDRAITYAQAFRDTSYTQIKTTHFLLTLEVPVTIAVNSTSINVFDSRTVLSAVTYTAVDVASPNYLASFHLLLSTQHPYELSYASMVSSSDISHSAVQVVTPACSIQADNSCNQEFQFSNLAITTGCPDKQVLDDNFTLTFNVGCKADFAGGCTPSPATADVSFTLVSTDYCPKVDNVTLSATLHTYRDVDINDVGAWSASSQTTQFVVGATVFGLVDVTVGQGAATTDSTTLRTLKSHTSGGDIELVTAGTPLAGSNVVVQDGTSTINFGGSYQSQTRFAVPLTVGVTAVLDPVIDQAQIVTFSATVDVTFTTSSQEGTGALLQDWAYHQTGQTHQARRFVTSSTERRPTAASATVLLSPATTAGASQPASGSSTTVAGMSFTVLAAVAALLVLVVVAVAYRAGRSREEHAPDEEAMQLKKSSSAVNVTETDEEAQA